MHYEVSLIEETKDLATGLLSAGLLVGHDTESGGHHDVAKASGGKDVLHPLLDAADGYVECGGDHTALIQSADQGNNDLAGAVVIEHLEFTNVA